MIWSEQEKSQGGPQEVCALWSTLVALWQHWFL